METSKMTKREMEFDIWFGKKKAICPRCKRSYDGMWQECDRCIEKVYPET